MVAGTRWLLVLLLLLATAAGLDEAARLLLLLAGRGKVARGSLLLLLHVLVHHVRVVLDHVLEVRVGLHLWGKVLLLLLLGIGCRSRRGGRRACLALELANV